MKWGQPFARTIRKTERRRGGSFRASPKGEVPMPHVNAPTQYVEANGVHYAYRRFGAESGVPLVFFQHFRGGMDHWDPAVTDGLGAGQIGRASCRERVCQYV